MKSRWSNVVAVGAMAIPRLTDEDRKILRRVTHADLADAFQTALDGDLEADQLLGGQPGPADAS